MSPEQRRVHGVSRTGRASRRAVVWGELGAGTGRDAHFAGVERLAAARATEFGVGQLPRGNVA